MPILKVWNGSAWIEATGASGDVVGPGSSTDNAVARFDSTTGKLVQNSGVLIDDSNNLTGVGSVNGSAAQSFLITDGSGVISALTPGNNALMISTSTGAPSVATPAANSYWTNNASSLYISVPLGANTFAGRLSGNPTDLSAAQARTILGVLSVRKTSNQDKTNDTTLADDSQLTLTASANTTYWFNLIALVKSNIVPDFKWGVSGPASSSAMIGSMWYEQNETSPSVRLFTVLTAGSSRSEQIVSSSGSHVLHLFGMVRLGGTAGNIALQWAQNTSDANITRVFADSFMTLTAQG